MNTVSFPCTLFCLTSLIWQSLYQVSVCLNAMASAVMSSCVFHLKFFSQRHHTVNWSQFIFSSCGLSLRQSRLHMVMHLPLTGCKKTSVWLSRMSRNLIRTSRSLTWLVQGRAHFSLPSNTVIKQMKAGTRFKSSYPFVLNEGSCK